VRTLLIRGYPTGQRIYAACAFGAFGMFFTWLYWTNRAGKDSWFGLIMIVVSFWLAAYWVFLPTVLGVLTPRGLDYRNEDLGLLFWYPWYHIDWDGVMEIRNYEMTGKGSPAMVTVLRATDANRPGKVRTYRISSGNTDYYRFLAYLREVVDPAKLAQGSLPLDPVLLRRQLQADQLRKLGGLGIAVAALVILAYLLRG
jgi:hypothetical protein